jgi:hypothetical protein
MVAKRIKFEGTIFKSKEDAAFAMSLSHAGWSWFYKPIKQGHRWAFLAWSNRDLPFPSLIDYHAEMPSRLYANNLTERMRLAPFESIIVWGSPWAPVDYGSEECCYNVYPVFTIHGNYGWGDFLPEMESGRSDLFSLQHQACEILGIDEGIARSSKMYIDEHLSHA